MTALLAGRQVLVLGATGGIGEGLVASFVRSGARVIAAGRNADRLKALQREIGDPAPGVLVCDVVDFGAIDPAVVRAQLVHYGRIDAAVISIGNWGPPGRLRIVDTSNDTWNAMIANNLSSHFQALRALTPMLDAQGVLIHLTGFSAEIPYPFAAMVGATNAAKKSLLRSLQAELGGAGPKVYELIIGPIRTRPRAAAGQDDARWYSAEQLGGHCADLIAGKSVNVGEALQYLVKPADGVRTAAPLAPPPSRMNDAG